MDRYERAEEFAKIFSQSRSDAGKSQEYLAKSLGVSRKTIQNWESGETSPTFFQSTEWFRILGVNPYRYYMEYLYNGCMSGISPSDDDKRIEAALLEIIKNSTPLEKRQLLYLMTGKHGSSWYCLLQMFVAHAHTSLKSRVGTARVILENYEMEKEIDSLVCMEHIQPDIEALRGAVERGKCAVKKRDQGY